MRLAFRAVASLSAVAALVTACSSASTSPIDSAVPTVLARQSAGTGGNSTGGGSTNTPVDPTLPVTSFVGRITALGAVPIMYYYTTPSSWDIDGKFYATTAGTVVKAQNGPLVIGACVNYTIAAEGSNVLVDIKTVLETKCTK